MSDRAAALTTFIVASPYAGAQRDALAGDASRRRYERLTLAGKTAILMDAPPDTGEDTRPFIRMAEHLSAIGLCPPQIIAHDVDQGFLLLSDLGADHFAAWLERHPMDEATLYIATADIIAAYHAAPAPDGLSQMDPSTGANMVSLFTEWHAPNALGIHDAVAEALAALPQTMALSLRDFHAENLIWRPDQTDTDRIGLLDFQDAFLAHPAYDLASLLRDARRDVADDTVRQTIRRYLDLTGLNAADFDRAFATIAVQRNLRILGIFARLIQRDNKPKYAAFVPRVRAHLERDLAHPALTDLSRLVTPYL